PRDVEPPPARERVAEERTAAAAGGRVHVVGGVLEEGRDLVAGQLGVGREEERRGGRDLRRREGGALRPPEVVRPAVGIADVGAAAVGGQRARDRREDVLARGGD